MTNHATAIEITVASEATTEIVAAFAHLLPQLSTSAKEITKEDLAAIIAQPSNSLLLARDQANHGKIVGTLTLVMFRIPTAMRAWIEDVVVDSNVRGRRVGELLTRKAVQLAVDHGAKTIDLTSRRSREAAHRLYEKVGFVTRDTTVYRYDSSTAIRFG
jgi:ribosomal protein S18 acetylase RimI-like enzyme